MTTAVAVVGSYLEAFEHKDADRMRSVLSDRFTFRGPMMSFDEPDAFVAAMKAFPCDATMENSRMVADGERVAHAFVFKMTAPVVAAIPMCEVFEVEGGKIRSSELYFDSKLFPALPS